jgi:MerR family transcriptional regulator, thiopeptide resistance regulator
MYTIGKLARKFGLSRSALLYYDRAGLLRPRGHAKGEYRLYDEEDAARLERIRQYREAGLSVNSIRDLLSTGRGEMRDILEKRLRELNGEILNLREQQHLLAQLLGSGRLASSRTTLTKNSWMELLKSAGFTGKDMDEWHARFEQTAPEKHEAFLRRLRLSKNEIKEIRKLAAKAATARAKTAEVD